MASTYSSLKIELIGTGDQSGTWGTTTNTNLGTAIEEAITGSADVAFSSADVTLTLTNTNGSQTARNLRLNLTGTSGGARNLTVPDIEKFYIISNGLADDVTVKNSTGTTYTIPAGTTGQIFSTGVGIKAAQSFFEGEILSSAAYILGGSIQATPIGSVTPSTGAFSSITNNVIFSSTGAITLPKGTTAQEPGSPTDGMIRYNTTISQFEGYNNSKWGAIGGAQANGAVYENTQIISSNYTMTTGYSGESVGPITIDSGVTVTIPSGSRWVVL